MRNSTCAPLEVWCAGRGAAAVDSSRARSPAPHSASRSAMISHLYVSSTRSACHCHRAA